MEFFIIMQLIATAFFLASAECKKEGEEMSFLIIAGCLITPVLVILTVFYSYISEETE